MAGNGRIRRIGENFGLAALDEFDVIAFWVVHREARTAVDMSLDCSHGYALRHEIRAQCGDIIGSKGEVIHAVGRTRIRRRAATDPLLANQISHETSRLHWRRGSQAERADVKGFRSIGRGGVERNVVDAENMRTLARSGLRDCREFVGNETERHREDSLNDSHNCSILPNQTGRSF